MPKSSQPSGPAPFHILMAGQAEDVTLIDGSTTHVWVRAMPVTYLVRDVLRLADRTADLIELCTYQRDHGGAPAPAHPQIPPPAGFVNVPHGFADNLKPASARRLFKVIKELNFTEAAEAAQDAIAAKEWQTPLLTAAEEVLMPVARKMAALLSYAATAPASSAAPKPKSASKRSRG